MSSQFQMVCFRIGCAVESLFNIDRLSITRIPNHHKIVGTAGSDEVTALHNGRDPGLPAQLGERRQSVVVTAKGPNRIAADLTK